MANPEHVEIVKQGAAAITAWRNENANTRLDLVEADLKGVDLNNANLSEGKLNNANLLGADLFEADLSRADLGSAMLSEANLKYANLHAANLSEADLHWAYLSASILVGANLIGANLIGAKLDGSNLSGANLSGANVEGAWLGDTIIADVDLSEVKWLESVTHLRPSSIAVDTLYKSRGKIPEAFLRGCGVPDALITYLPSLIGAMEPIQFQSCFISYSSKDDEFARRLYDRMRGEKLRVWFDQEDMQGGKKVMEQIDRAIQVNDRLLLVLSDSSLKSEWVKTEIRKARKVERSQGRRKLFPIRLVSVGRLEKWKCFATDPDEDLAAEVRSYHLPDFSNWKDHDAFEAAFADLLRDLRAEA